MEDPGWHQIGGERLCGVWSLPLRAAMLQFRGDWPCLSGTLGLVSHASGQFCFKFGTRKEDPWTDPSPHAARRRTLVDHDERS